MDPSSANDVHGGSGRRTQDEDEGATTTKAVAERDPGAIALAVPARRGRSSTPERTLVGSPGGSESGGESSAAQESVDEKGRNGEPNDTVREKRGGERGRSNSTAGEIEGFAASRQAPGPAPGDCPPKALLQTAADHRPFDAAKAASSSIKLDPLEPRSAGGGTSESAAEVSQSDTSTGRIRGGASRDDARDAKPRVSKEVEDGQGKGPPMSRRGLQERGQETESTAAPSRNVETGGVAPVVLEASDKCGDVEGGSRGGRGFSDDSSHTSAGSSWTSRTGDSRSSSGESTAASTRASGSSVKERAAGSAMVKRGNSSSSSGGGRRRRRSRSRSKTNEKEVVAGGTLD